jgi:exodeoxyribonuclease VII small subunit
MAKKQTNKKGEVEEMSFEQAIEMLTGIVDKIESGQVSLADSLEQYERGMALIKHCRGILLDAEKRIEEIAEEEEPPEAGADDEDEAEDEDDDALF